MVSLRQLAYDALANVSVYIGSLYGYSGTVFNQGEWAFFKVRVTNNTGLTLRDVVAKTYVFGAAKIDPIVIFGLTIYDGEESWGELEPYQSKTYTVRIKGTSAGTARIRVYISAEVVPYATRYRAGRDVTVVAA